MSDRTPKLVWQWTVIGGESKPYDYTARDGDTPVGRIIRVDYGPGIGRWRWSMYHPAGLGRPGFSPCTGVVDSKQEAADKVRECYWAALALPPHKPRDEASHRNASDAEDVAVRGDFGSETMPSKRELIEPHKGDKRYVRRDESGRFKESDEVGRSLSADRRRKAKTVAKPGQGDRGDRKRPH